MRCKMKAMIMDMCILSHKTLCFLMFGHVGVGAGKLRGFTVSIQHFYFHFYSNPQKDRNTDSSPLRIPIGKLFFVQGCEHQPVVQQSQNRKAGHLEIICGNVIELPAWQYVRFLGATMICYNDIMWVYNNDGYWNIRGMRIFCLRDSPSG